MSTTQAIASSRFLTAMGPMIADEAKMSKVLKYIVSLRANDVPCQFSESEVIALADQAEKEYAMGTGMTSHSDFLQEVATWH